MSGLTRIQIHLHVNLYLGLSFETELLHHIQIHLHVNLYRTAIAGFVESHIFKYIYMLIFIVQFIFCITPLTRFKYIYMLIFIKKRFPFSFNISLFKYIYMLIFIQFIQSSISSGIGIQIHLHVNLYRIVSKRTTFWPTIQIHLHVNLYLVWP